MQISAWQKYQTLSCLVIDDWLWFDSSCDLAVSARGRSPEENLKYSSHWNETKEQTPFPNVIFPPYPQSISTLRPVLLGPRDSQGEMEADPWAAFGPRNNGPKVHVSGRGDGDVARLCSPPPARQGSLPLGSFRSSLAGGTTLLRSGQALTDTLGQRIRFIYSLICLFTFFSYFVLLGSYLSSRNRVMSIFYVS